MNTYPQEDQLDRLSAIIPLRDFGMINITAPGLYRVPVDSHVANEMLSKNIKNRRQRRVAVEAIKQQIKNGEWREDHPQPIVFSNRGRLIDGQHRLQAILEMGVTKFNALTLRVETGANDEVREYMDTGVPRTLDDRVGFVEDHPQNKVIAQLCQWDFAKQARRRPSPEEAKAFFEEHRHSCMFVAYTHKRERGVGKIQIAYAAMEYFERSPLKAQRFYPALFVVDSDVQQARILRDYVLRTMQTVGNYENTQKNRIDIYLRSICAMKAHSENREIKILRRAEW